jgi:hypothetical protein
VADLWYSTYSIYSETAHSCGHSSTIVKEMRVAFVELELAWVDLDMRSEKIASLKKQIAE